VGEALAGLHSAGVSRKQFKFLGKQADFTQSGAQPQGLAEQAMGRRVIRFLKVEMPIAMEFALFPDGRVVSGGGQRQQGGAFDVLKAGQRHFPGRAVEA